MLTFFEKQIYFLLLIISIRYINIQNKINLENHKFKTIFLFIMSGIFDYIFHMRFGSNGIIWWFLIFYKLNKQFFILLIMGVFFINKYNSCFIIILNYLLMNNFLYEE